MVLTKDEALELAQAAVNSDEWLLDQTDTLPSQIAEGLDADELEMVEKAALHLVKSKQHRIWLAVQSLFSDIPLGHSIAMGIISFFHGNAPGVLLASGGGALHALHRRRRLQPFRDYKPIHDKYVKIMQSRCDERGISFAMDEIAISEDARLEEERRMEQNSFKPTTVPTNEKDRYRVYEDIRLDKEGNPQQPELQPSDIHLRTLFKKHEWQKPSEV